MELTCPCTDAKIISLKRWGRRERFIQGCEQKKQFVRRTYEPEAHQALDRTSLFSKSAPSLGPEIPRRSPAHNLWEERDICLVRDIGRIPSSFLKLLGGMSGGQLGREGPSEEAIGSGWGWRRGDATTTSRTPR
eukprot:408407-Rhodomonas_salina.1